MKLAEIDNVIDRIIQDLRTEFNDPIFQIIGEFSVERLNEIEFEKYNFSGIYLFEIDMGDKFIYGEWVKAFIEKWEDPYYKKNFTPNSRKVRKDKHEDRSDRWLPLYLGRSKDIGKRLKGHINLELKKPTTGLKLLARKNIYDEKFRIQYLKVDVKNYNFIMPYVESWMRDKFNPILGRQ
ncbi:hypothetical protein SAMN04488029_2696 [Reichenbachiella faecimaris]|uniref:Uncharacterized protein n=1 Tax=Reichenbachiella faecimaris TaxID=692418 RepID=A0A1W2GHW7_REIFA|nr:hypothetical protein [Reichenbachiella faecimaris]SMD36072.1 hypothetical protein SAMN04488029_2696 [Reichenbachiella faecimaris]